MQEVKISIVDGVPTITVKGVAGRACREITASLEAKLGTVKTRKDTPEMNLTPAKTHTQNRTH